LEVVVMRSLGQQGVRIGRVLSGRHCGGYVVVSQFDAGAALIEFAESPDSHGPFEAMCLTADELDRHLAAQRIDWLPDDREALYLADDLLPLRFLNAVGRTRKRAQRWMWSR
jgi:hypothetical protein